VLIGLNNGCFGLTVAKMTKRIIDTIIISLNARTSFGADTKIKIIKVASCLELVIT
jgi:hypothetical protein